MSQPRISIVTPSFNQGIYLEQTIQSVLDQGYPNLEYFIIDGGSTDGSVDIIRKYSDRVAYWVSEPDRGQSHAINKGLARATGDILAYLNSDDVYVEGALWRVAAAFVERPSADLVHGVCRTIDANGHAVGRREGRITRYDEIVDLWGVWWSQRNFVQPEVFWSRRIAERAGRFREDLNWVMDYDYWLRILGAGGNVVKLDAELAAFRLHSAQKSEQSEQAVAELLEVVKPHLFGATRTLGPTKRTILRGKWLFDARFRPAADASARQGQSRCQRWKMLLAMLASNPEMLCAPVLYRRAFHAFWG
jgi:glycosyltransferase involved in cell wall biosynthesis